MKLAGVTEGRFLQEIFTIKAQAKIQNEQILLQVKWFFFFFFFTSCKDIADVINVWEQAIRQHKNDHAEQRGKFVTDKYHFTCIIKA